MNGGVKSLNCLHVLCLILDESNFEHRQILDLKRDFLYLHVYTEKQVEHLKITTTGEIAIEPKN